MHEKVKINEKTREITNSSYSVSYKVQILQFSLHIDLTEYESLIPYFFIFNNKEKLFN